MSPSPLVRAIADPAVVGLLDAWGTPYSWGGGGPSTPWLQFGAGVDCSGWAQIALVHLGLLARTKPDRNSATLAAACTTISAEADHKLGDLAFYGSRGVVTHVMVVLGPGVVFGAHGGGSKTHGDDPTAYVGVECLHYRRDLLFVGRLPTGG
jgi:cell wall-associated NlpC family hydrolase